MPVKPLKPAIAKKVQPQKADEIYVTGVTSGRVSEAVVLVKDEVL